MRKLLSWFFVAFLLLQASCAFAQDYPGAKYDWEPNRKITYQPNDSELEMPAVIILDERYFDYIKSDKPDHFIGPGFILRSKKYEFYYSQHRIVRVNDDRGIDRFNKIVISLNEGDKIVSLKARTLNPDGSIIELSKEKFLDISNNEVYDNLKVFALEGVEKGSELEYVYTVKFKRPTMSGVETIQHIFPIKKEKITITSPYTLVFNTRSYNNFPEATVAKTVYGDQVIITDSVENIPPVNEEPFAPANANVMKLTYKLADDDTENIMHKSGWNRIGTMLYDGLTLNVDETNLSAIIKKLNLKSVSRDEQIMRIEDFIKGSVQTIPVDTGDENFYFNPQNVLERRTGTSFGIIRLYIAFFRKLTIPFNLVFTSDRTEGRFDADNIIPEDFREKLFYFPISEKFLTPFSKVTRYGFAPAEMAFNNGLFIDGLEGKIDFINGMKMNNTSEMLNAEVTLDTGMYAAGIKEQFNFSGYRAIDILGNYEISDSAQKEKIMESFMQRRGISDAKISDQEINIQPVNNSGVKKLSLTTHYQSNSLIEKAGKDYLLNIGLIIHKQPRINKEGKNRMSDIEIPYPIQYLHHLHVAIPAGYKVKGLDDLKMDKAVVDSNGERTCQFTSSYSLNGNNLDINISETFSKPYYEKQDFNNFRQVINAAADFNKVQLVLEKE